MIETHSEHLILRLLRRIRETTEGKIAIEAQKLQPEDVSVLYVEQTKLGTEAMRLRVAPVGVFIDPWPQGFFEERGEELF